MTVAAPRPRPKLPPLLLAALASAPNVRASEDCLLDYANGVDGASDLQGFWRRSGAGLRCYLDLLSCLQRRLA